MEDLSNASRFLSYILRHHPESIGLEIDSKGWAYLPALIEKSNKKGRNLSLEVIHKIIETGTRQRFILSEDGHYIRAGYGHSIDVDLGLEPEKPPEILFHGTARKNLNSIQKNGLHSGSRNLVHLSSNREDAITVGGRHGKPVVLNIMAGKMYTEGHPFYRSDSEPDIWLTEAVPPRYIEENQ